MSVIENPMQRHGKVRQSSSEINVSAANRNGKGLSNLAPSIPRDLTDLDKQVISFVDSTDWRHTRLRVDDPTHRELAARTLAVGGAIMYPFGNFYALAMGPDIASVRAVNEAKGRPVDQTASIVTTPEFITQRRFENVFDFTQLPEGMSPDQAIEMMRTFYEMGPFGFRGRAAEHIATRHPHLTQAALVSFGIELPTVQVIAPGERDRTSNEVIGRGIEMSGIPYMAITSANLSSHRDEVRFLREQRIRSGQVVPKDEPAHWLMRGIQEEFGGSEFPFVLLANPDEHGTVAQYPDHAPMSTSVIGFHRALPMIDGQPTVSVERHGSMPLSTILRSLKNLKINALVTQSAVNQLTQRTYVMPLR